ncbi:hypothetical protein R1flu_021625 [Riccia fluitans]|uniref:Uncharacterized protein n=1 Tax=Riccia fluitans TaxID=41844 RepID=A0ABD1ZR42_9MARC
MTVPYLAQRWKYTAGDVQIQELESVNILRKYSGVLEIFLSTVAWLWSRKEGDGHCFVTPNPLTSVETMKQLKSQWLWFRRLPKVCLVQPVQGEGMAEETLPVLRH